LKQPQVYFICPKKLLLPRRARSGLAQASFIRTMPGTAQPK